MYILDSASSSSYQQFTKTKGDGRIILRVQSSLSLIPLVYLCNKSPTRPLTQQKKISRPSSSSPQLLPLFSILSFPWKLQPSSIISPPFSMMASPTLAIIRSRHTSSLPIHCSRHANHPVPHSSPKSTKLPIQEYSKSSRHEDKRLN